ncbi:MAG TPA: ATP-binding protein [Bryobacteraceae bacterium]|nr:ATP-binding protein [Bryobacteraceae bacterium]
MKLHRAVTRYLSAAPVVRYLLPVSTVVAALLLNVVTIWMLPRGSDFPYAFYYLIAVFVAAWYGGYLPGLAACVLIMIALPALTDQKFTIARFDWGRFIVLSAVSSGVSAVAAAQQRRAAKLIEMNAELDHRVHERTEELTRTVQALEAEVGQHRDTGAKLRTQIERLNLLNQVTRAIGERQDLRSVYQVVVRALEDNLPIDFGCVCLLNPDATELTVAWVGVRSADVAVRVGLTEGARVEIDQSGLARCAAGDLVYEPDMNAIESPFPQRLLRGGLNSLVAAPLLSESRVFGILVAARREPDSFSSGDCEFLRQLSEHIALAAHQAHMYEALQNAYDDLRQTQLAVMQQERLRALGQMAGGIAHDINNALSPMALYTESLLEREPALSARTRDYLETARTAIQDITHTVSRMREFSRQREPQWVLMPLDLNKVIPHVLDLTRARWSDMPLQRGITVHVRTDLTQDLPTVAGIESEIREALTNLIFNAVDAMPEGGTLTVRTSVAPGAGSAAGKTVVLEVEDTGIGMDEETGRRCQEPFFTTKGERGTGLGLPMVYATAQRHNAELEIRSERGKGTATILRFPIPAAIPASAPESGYRQPMPPRLRILIIDDDPLVVKCLRDTLETDGHTVHSANGGKEGIEAFEAGEESRQRFAAVITDLGMPYDGRRVAAAVKERSPNTPVVLLTGWGQRLVEDGGMPPFVDRVLSKPPKLHQLREALAELSTGNDRSVHA